MHGGRRAAETALAKLITEVKEQRQGPGGQAPLTDLVEAWLTMVEEDLSPTTVTNYRSILARQIAPTIGKLPVGEVTTPALDAFYRQLLEKRAPATVRQTHAVLRRAFRWGWLATNPAAEATPPRVKRRTLNITDPAQVGALIAAADASDPSFGCLLRVAAATGARRGELAGLRWSKIDLDRRELVIDEAVARVKSATIVKDTKTHQARRVALDPGTVAALEAHWLRCNEAALQVGVARADDPYVWATDVDGLAPGSPDLLTAAFRRLAKTHAPGCRLHDLRHFAATQLLAAGVPVKTVSGRLGHGSAAMTLDVYGHHIAAADQGAADVLGALLDGAATQ